MVLNVHRSECITSRYRVGTWDGLAVGLLWQISSAHPWVSLEGRIEHCQSLFWPIYSKLFKESLTKTRLPRKRANFSSPKRVVGSFHDSRIGLHSVKLKRAFPRSALWIHLHLVKDREFPDRAEGRFVDRGSSEPFEVETRHETYRKAAPGINV